MSQIRPLQDFVLIEPSEAPEKSPGGIIIAPTAKEKPTEGKVLAVGPGRFLADGTRRKPEVEVGVTVIFNQYAGVEVDIQGEKYRMLREDDILAMKL